MFAMIITLGLLGTLQEQIFSAIVQTQVSTASAQAYVASSKIFSIFFPQFLPIINPDIWNP